MNLLSMLGAIRTGQDIINKTTQKFDKGFLMLQGRIKEIKYLIQKHGKDPKIRQIAADILTQKTIVSGTTNLGWAIKQKDYLAELKAIFKWVRENIRYQFDPVNKDIIESPFTTIKLKLADCDGLTVLIGSLAQSMGYPVVIKIIKQGDTGRMYHIYPLVGIPPSNPRGWIALDAIFNKPIGYQVEYSKMWKIKV